MNHTVLMQSFEKEKNLKATYITAGICGLLLLIAFLLSWTTAPPPPPAFEDGIEVNLGNSDQGLGDVQPLLPGPAAASEDNISPPKQQVAQVTETKEYETNDKDAEAPPVVKKEIKKPDPIKKPVNTEVKKPTTKAVVNNPTPAPPKPKAVYKGGTANNAGGNNADTYNNSRNQGIAGGKGDQGKINGNPNSDRYDGNGGSGNSGFRVGGGLSGRGIAHRPSFQEDFDENAVIRVEVKVDQAGNCTFMRFGRSTSTNPTLQAIARQKVSQIKFVANPNAPDEQFGTIEFNFRVTQ